MKERRVRPNLSKAVNVEVELAKFMVKVILNKAFDKGTITLTRYNNALNVDYGQECLISGYAATNKAGYTQVRLTGCSQKLKVYCHMIVKQAEGIRIGLGDTGSHLCNTPSCFNPSHIVIENIEISQSRKCCKLFGHMQMYYCPHSPPCMGCNSIF